MNADNQIPIDMLRIGRNLRSEEEVKAIQRNKDETRQQIRIWYEYFFVIAGFMLLLRMSLLDSIPPYIPFVILAFYQIKVLFHTIFLIKRSIDSLHRSHQLKELIISTCTLSTYIFTICYTANVFKYLFLISGPILLTNLISIFKKTNVNSKCLEFAHKSESTYRWVFGTTLLFAGLKELKLVNWNWFYIFWPIWLFVCILLMVGIGEIIFLGKQIFRSIRGRGPCSETLCPVWMIYITFGVSCCVCYLFYEIALNAEGIPNGKIPDALLVLLLYFIGLFTLTFLLSTFLQ